MEIKVGINEMISYFTYDNSTHLLLFILVSRAEIIQRIYYFLINELRDDNGCENLHDLSVRSWCEFEDDYDEDCEDSDDEYQVIYFLDRNTSFSILIFISLSIINWNDV